ncbi:sugar phosphate isomerase/epimerase [uncultured Pseudokineococcus sp.]|uniref:sugar phosphate isomerase/epimerase family protein n=1 Tax=uncultured Pseudokineococcus sp. TaxID=1642928 RepID=UPI00261FA550|nr:sugar phosphate isomerase/epimerase family protein [uncultured Pseudokineococcus sp.]
MSAPVREERAPADERPADLARLSLNTATTKRWTLEQAVEGAARAGLPAVGLWRDRVEEAGLERAARLVRDAGLRVSSLCRGGFLTAADPGDRRAALDDNRRAVEEAATLGTRDLVMVLGGLPEGDRDLLGARARAADALAELVPHAHEHGVRLLLEPLHPMYCADRAVLSTLDQALDVAGAHPAQDVAVVVDTFHVWWDPELEAAVARAGAEGRLGSYQVCDFLVPIAEDPLLSRGIMGDGVVDFAPVSRWVAAAGYGGDVEVEVFNAEVWASDGHEVLARVVERYAELVLPHL